VSRGYLTAIKMAMWAYIISATIVSGLLFSHRKNVGDFLLCALLIVCVIVVFIFQRRIKLTE